MKLAVYPVQSHTVSLIISLSSCFCLLSFYLQIILVCIAYRSHCSVTCKQQHGLTRHRGLSAYATSSRINSRFSEVNRLNRSNVSYVCASFTNFTCVFWCYHRAHARTLTESVPDRLIPKTSQVTNDYATRAAAGSAITSSSSSPATCCHASSYSKTRPSNGWKTFYLIKLIKRSMARTAFK
jgi:hypothetical protein